ncbi:MAG: glycoside hydrolase family 15 protein [Cellvibrio sp.]|uniref:glycoside hydrolase family 15 protein n=1 Tax=Cellvibrio sp. TaxID=1965322 RepID=UPI002728524A|nr:glycoside hydrolase family 15 protein [Cellvibrio sp.]
MKHKQLLERVYAEVETVILSKQHPVTGLLPASTAINNHGDYTDAWVRDNVYSIVCVWTLGMAFRHQGEDHKSDQLQQSTIKLMRGLLQSMMRQAHKVEKFKHSLENGDALHAKYDTATGLPVVADDAWGHLQIDATSVFLLMLAQMSASGLRIVCTHDEVDFVQNLVYYIASAYRTPDYGIWERGNKVNNGKTEINASSVGMAKAALQALDGFNLFGKYGDKRAVVHVIADAISLARTTLASLLPRESLSKETDSALLSIIGFPAFAVGKETLATQTRDSVLTKLGGNYGCKRFLWDGHQTVLEESSRIYYEHDELGNFANVESEWPLFFTYLYITALFDGSDATAKHYRKKLESLMVQVDGIGLLPELYYLPVENVDAEKKNPRSQTRVPNENIPLVWAQSLYLTGLMLDEGLVSTDDLDPLKMRRRSTRFIKSNIALVVLAENDTIKQHLAKHGVIAESLQDIKPMGVLSASSLMEAYAHVGENKSLGLTGRPRRRVQSLATSQTYEINNKVYLSLSWLQSEREDYRRYDAQWVIENLTQEIQFIYKNWLSSEVAVFTLMMDHRLYKVPNAELLFATLRGYQLRTEHEYVGYASANLAHRASRVNSLTIPYFHIPSMNSQILVASSDDDSLQPAQLEPVAAAMLEHFYTESDIITYRKFSIYVKGRKLSDNIGAEGEVITVKDLIRDFFFRSQKVNYWLLSRFCFSQLNYTLTDLADSLTLLAARNLAITVGDNNHTQIKVDQSFSNATYFESVRQLFPDLLERTLVQELLSAIGSLIRSETKLFDGLHSVQLRNFMLLCGMDKGDAEDVSMIEWLGLQSPAKLYKKIRSILTSRKKVFSQGINHITPYRIHHNENSEDENPVLSDAMDTDWLEWRTARGLITHFDANFLKDIWHSLMFAQSLVFSNASGGSFHLDCKTIRQSMTPGEESFAHLIDKLTHQLYPAYYKSAVVEALYAYTQFCINNPQMRFQKPLIFREVLERAAARYMGERRAQMSSLGIETDLTVFMQQSPHIVNLYVTLIYAEITQPY